MLEVKHLSYEVTENQETLPIVTDISFTVNDGEMLVITGPNGGGKSTIARLLMGIIKETSGSVLLDGEDITKLSIDERAKEGIGFAFQQPPSFKGMTVRRMLNLAAGKELPEPVSCRLLSSVGLCAKEYLDREVDATLSGGEKKRVDRGFEASFVGVTSNGEISVEEIEKAIKENTALVSILYVNNEIGSISDVSRVSEICKSHNIALHSDLTQALGKLEIDVKKLGIDYASCSAHKIYGPKGIGAAYMKSDAYGIAPITAFMHGGEQEFGYRAGTHAVHNIVGFGKAAEIALRDMKKNETHIQKLDELLLHGIANIDGIHTTVDESKRIPGIVSLVVEKEDFHNERFIKKISEEVALSTGSACSAGEPSYVIQALGLGNKVTKVLRVSINKFTTESDINEFIKILRAEI